MRKNTDNGQTDGQEPADTSRRPILVVGVTGKTGRRVAERLAARGLPVRAGSRTGEPPFDWLDRATWPAALAGVDAVYLTYYPDIAIPGAVDAVRAFTALAAGQGVRHIVLLSGRGEEEAQRAEEVVRESGIAWTIVRSSWFSQNFSENFMVDGVVAGEIALPAGNVPEPFIDVEDIAEVVVAALTEDGHAGQLYEVTGPRLLTFADAVAEISKATGREIRFVPITGEAFAAGLAEAGVPGDVAWLMDYLFATVLDGRNAHLTDGVQRALGRAPRDFRDYARETAASGAWDASAVPAAG